MSRIAYVNGHYVAHARAGVHVEDRGYQFADGVYEVIAIYDGRLVDEGAHLDRLDRSLAAVRMAWPVSRRALEIVLRRVVALNRICERGSLYLQVTRGVALRDHRFPAGVVPSLVVTARALPPLDVAALRRGVAVVTLPDQRWRRVDIKSTGLLPNVLGRQQAVEAGAEEAWLVDGDGRVTEGTASNAWIVTNDREVVTRQADMSILAGVTRRVVLEIVADRRLTLVERAFSVDEARAAAEAFLTSTTSTCKPVVRIDDHVIGDGKIGPVTDRLLQAYLRHLGVADDA